MKSAVAAFLGCLCITCNLLSDAVGGLSLAELRKEAPETLSFSIDGRDRAARVILPAGERMPVYQVTFGEGEGLPVYKLLTGLALPGALHPPAEAQRAFCSAEPGLTVNGARVLQNGYPFIFGNKAGLYAWSGYAPWAGDEEIFFFGYRRLVETLRTEDVDAPLIDWATLKAAVQERIDAGMLERVFTLELCYQVMYRRLEPGCADSYSEEVVRRSRDETGSVSSERFPARLYLVPVWEALGAGADGVEMPPNRSRRSEAAAPTRPFGFTRIRINAMTGELLTSAAYLP